MFTTSSTFNLNISLFQITNNVLTYSFGKKNIKKGFLFYFLMLLMYTKRFAEQRAFEFCANKLETT